MFRVEGLGLVAALAVVDFVDGGAKLFDAFGALRGAFGVTGVPGSSKNTPVLGPFRRTTPRVLWLS